MLASGVGCTLTVDCVAGPDPCVGTPQNDTINGSEEPDRIMAQGGIDQTFANGGNDLVQAGEGNDTARGGEGEDELRGQRDADELLYGDAGEDGLIGFSFRGSVDDPNVLSGGAGDDYLFGFTKLYGGAGNDYLEVGLPYAETKTVLNGGAGHDTMVGDLSADTVRAVDGERDRISCGGNMDIVYFDAGIDSVNPANCERRIGQSPPE